MALAPHTESWLACSLGGSRGGSGPWGGRSRARPCRQPREHLHPSVGQPRPQLPCSTPSTVTTAQESFRGRDCSWEMQRGAKSYVNMEGSRRGQSLCQRGHVCVVSSCVGHVHSAVVWGHMCCCVVWDVCALPCRAWGTCVVVCHVCVSAALPSLIWPPPPRQQLHPGLMVSSDSAAQHRLHPERVGGQPRSHSHGPWGQGGSTRLRGSSCAGARCQGRVQPQQPLQGLWPGRCSVI